MSNSHHFLAGHVARDKITGQEATVAFTYFVLQVNAHIAFVTLADGTDTVRLQTELEARCK